MNPESKMPEFIVKNTPTIKKIFVMVIAPLLLLSITVTIANYKKGSKPIEAQPNATITTLINSSSTRAFINQKIDPNTIDLIVKCGIKAPSAMNQQPWHFSVVQNRKIINNKLQITKEFQNPNDKIQMNSKSQNPNLSFDI